MQNMSWAIKHWFSVKQNYVLSILPLYTNALPFLTNIKQLCVANDYFVLPFIECKMNLISFMKTVLNASLFFRKNLL